MPSPDGEEPQLKSTEQMILSEKDLIDVKLTKEDGHKILEIGTKGVYMCALLGEDSDSKF